MCQKKEVAKACRPTESDCHERRYCTLQTYAARLARLDI